MSGGRGRCVLTLCAGPLFVRGPSASLIEPFCGHPFGNRQAGVFFAKEHWRAPSGRAPGGEDVGRHTVGLACVALLREAAVPDPGFRSGSPFASSDLARLRHRALGGVLARTLYFSACSGSAYSCEKPERSVLMAVLLLRHPEESQQNRAFSRRA